MKDGCRRGLTECREERADIVDEELRLLEGGEVAAARHDGPAGDVVAVLAPCARDEREFVLDNTMLHHAVDYTPYAGQTLRAWPGLTIASGEVVWDGKAFRPRKGHGRFLACGAPSLLPRRGGAER